MNHIDYSGQLGIFNPSNFGWPVHVIGCGGIGAALIHELTKLGIPELHIWDDDEVEEHNIPAQTIYRPSDVGKLKVVAAYEFLERQEVTQTCRVIGHAERVSESTRNLECQSMEPRGATLSGRAYGR